MNKYSVKSEGYDMPKTEEQCKQIREDMRNRILMPGLVNAHGHGPMTLLRGVGGGLALQEGNFVDAKGCVVRLTPMQQQLMEMLWQSPSHKLSKTEICDALWPKKEDASETLYTLVRRLKPIIEEHSNLKIEVDRGRAYGLTIR